MLEMLVAGGGKPYYPNSGPGPKSLAGGNEQAGYFGTLTQNQLFTPTELFNLLSIPAIGPSVDSSLIWCKFFYKGKVVYIPTRPIHDGSLQPFSWEDLYKLGLVYGTDDNGVFPSPAGSPVNQRVTLSKTLENKTAGFWPRLAAAYDTDPIDTTTASASGKGEFAELLSNVYQLGFRFGTGKWDGLPTSSLDPINSAMMKTSAGTGTALMIGSTNAAKGLMNYGSSGKTVRQASWCWWPVLQYINPAENLLDLTDFKADSPPPKAVDLYVDKGEAIGGLITPRSVRGVLMGGRVSSSATASLLAPVTKVTVGLSAKAPSPIAVSEPPRSPVNVKVGLLSKPPVATAKQSALSGPYGLKVTYIPTPVIGLKVTDQ